MEGLPSSYRPYVGICLINSQNQFESDLVQKSSTNSDAAKEKKGTPASPATALAKRVFPVPGGPTKWQPLGILAPRAVYLSGFFKKSTTSCNSSFAWSAPATSPKVTPGRGREAHKSRCKFRSFTDKICRSNCKICSS